MRRSLSLALLLVALSALPAAARGGGGGGGGVHAIGLGSHPPVSHVNHFNRFGKSRFFAPRGRNSSWGNRGRGWGNSGQDWNSGWSGGWDPGWDSADWNNWGGAPWAGAPGIAAPPPVPAKATVDTEAGVTVVRGPGSHHLGRY